MKFVVACMLAGTSLFALPAVAADNPPRAAGPKAAVAKTQGQIRVAQACGWYVISGCFRDYDAAARRAGRIGAFVVDTSSGAYPNFRPGWFCAAFGPYDQYTAKSKSHYIKPSYIKNAC